eukprot:1462436-Rhodomonas_salina.1
MDRAKSRADLNIMSMVKMGTSRASSSVSPESADEVSSESDSSDCWASSGHSLSDRSLHSCSKV